MLYRANRLLSPDDWESFLRQGCAIATLFSQKVSQLDACTAPVPEKLHDVCSPCHQAKDAGTRLDHRTV